MHAVVNVVLKRTRLVAVGVVVLALMVSVSAAQHAMNRVDQRATVALVHLVANSKPVTAGPTPRAQIVPKAVRPNRSVAVSVHTTKTYLQQTFSMTATVHVTMATTAKATTVYGETVTFATVDHPVARVHPSAGQNVTTHHGGTTYVDTTVTGKVTTAMHRTYRATGVLHTTITSNGAVRVVVLDVHRV